MGRHVWMRAKDNEKAFPKALNFTIFLYRQKMPKCKIYVVHFCIVNGRLVLSTRLGIFNLVLCFKR